MRKEILLLTKSKKHKGLCIAGIDISNGNWTRLTLKGEDSVPTFLFKYKDGSKPELMDSIIVDVLGECGTDLHPEDVYFNPTNILKSKVDRSNLLIKRITLDADANSFIYYNQEPKLSEADVAKLDPPYSLIAINPEDLYFRRDETRAFANFRYNGKSYYNLRVTDLTLKAELFSYPTNTIIRLDRKMYLVISLGEKYEEKYGGYHYKLVAAAIDASKVTEYKKFEINYDEILTIGELYNKYVGFMEEPIAVHKSTWTDDYYMVIEGVTENSAFGTTYKGKCPYRKEWRKLNEGQFSMYKDASLC